MGMEYYYIQSYLIFVFAVLSGSFIHSFAHGKALC